MTILTRWPYDKITIFTTWPFLPNDQMTILTRWPHDKLIRWPHWPDHHIDQITKWPYWADNQHLKKPHQSPQKWDVISQIPDTMMIYDDLTTVKYNNIIKNNSNQLPRKAWPEPPKLARHLPYQIQWQYMITVTPCSHITVTNCSPTDLNSCKNRKSPSSLRSLWGLIKVAN